MKASIIPPDDKPEQYQGVASVNYITRDPITGMIIKSFTLDEHNEMIRSDVTRYIPLKRIDDRWLPGIVIGWAVNFDESFLKWRVWNGLIDRMDHPKKDPIYGYYPHLLDDGCCEEASCAVLIKYPESEPQDEKSFIAWANNQCEMHYNSIPHHEQRTTFPL